MNTVENNKKHKNKKILVATIVGAFALVGAGTYIASGGSDVEDQASVKVQGEVEDTGVPAHSQDKDYIQEVEKKNAHDAEQALNEGKSHIDTFTNKVKTEVNESEFDRNASMENANENVEETVSNNQIRPIEPEVVIHEKIITVEKLVPQIEKYDYMKDVSLLASLGIEKNTPKTFTVSDVSNRQLREKLESEMAEKKLEREKDIQFQKETEEKAMNTTTVYKIGDLIPATLQTEINTTRPSFVRARIEGGPLAGSILVGNFNQNHTSVTVNFTHLNIPGADKSLPINGVAMDFKTASTALASSVNRHLPEKILMTFASSFAKGFADGLKDNNVEGTEKRKTSDGNSITDERKRPKTNKEINKEATATAINSATEELGSLVPQRPTVKVKGNSEIGVYLTEDLVIENKYLQ